MKKSGFLHVADVHLDSPLHRICKLDEQTAQRVQQASRQSFVSVVDTALEHEVAALIIAGDLFDGPIQDASAGLWVERQFRRLTQEGIQVALILGNHDAVSNAAQVVDWPAGVHQFAAGSPESVVLEEAGIAIHGQSFGAREESADLAARYPSPTMGFFNLGVLHTSLAGSGTHDTYAPTSVSVLEDKGYDYWALGHIHVRTEDSLGKQCYIGYSGNTQGRHIHEAGAKGCLVGRLEDGQLTSHQFVPTDCLRWLQHNVDASQFDHLRDIDEQIQNQIPRLLEEAQGRPLALRVVLQGDTRLHADLSRPGCLQRLEEDLAEQLGQAGDIWLETIKLRTTPFVASRAADVITPLKYLSQVSQEARTDPVLREESWQTLEELLKKTRRELEEYGWSLEQEGEFGLDELLSRAENMLVARMMAE